MDVPKYDLATLFKQIRNQFLAATLAYGVVAITACVALAVADQFLVGGPVILVLSFGVGFLFYKLHKNTEVNPVISSLKEQLRESEISKLRDKTTDEASRLMLDFADALQSGEFDLPPKQRRNWLTESLATAFGNRSEQLEESGHTDAAMWFAAIAGVLENDLERRGVIESLSPVRERKDTES